MTSLPLTSGGRILALLAFSLCISTFLQISETSAEDVPNQIFSQPEVSMGSSGIEDDLNPLNKRMSSFMPMRGRRGYENLQSPSNGYHENKRYSSFSPSRGKKDSVQFGLDKKGSAFLPMRGRRYFDEEEGYEQSSKRAAFMPMRGRKSGPPSTLLIDSKFLEDDLDKTRDAKWDQIGNALIDESTASDPEKRASSFTHMRGRKKAMYGKGSIKRLNSFMPMRGKKNSAEESSSGAGNLQPSAGPNGQTRTEEEEEQIEEAVSQALQRAAAMEGMAGDKRAAAFYGMRGKRHISNSFLQPQVKREAVFYATRG